MRLLVWGTYDTGKPRIRLLLEGLHRRGVSVTECHASVWEGIEDKSSILGTWRFVSLAWRWLSSYPRLIVAFLRAPKPDVVLVGYLGQLDVLVLWPFAKMRGVPVVWDAFVLLYNTVVEDRRLVSPGNVLAWVLFAWEWLACRAVDRVLMDTRAHAAYVCERFGVGRARVADVAVGAEDPFLARGAAPQAVEPRPEGSDLDVFFYGQFIPLHGIETLIAAARLAEGEAIRWTIVGGGQEEAKIRAMLDAHPLPRIEWIPSLPYEELPDRIAAADVCLGIFGRSDKAARVVPTKVYQILAVGTPLVTRDSPAMRELLPAGDPRVALVAAGEPGEVLAAVRSLGADRIAGRLPAANPAQRIGADEVGSQIEAILEDVLS